MLIIMLPALEHPFYEKPVISPQNLIESAKEKHPECWTGRTRDWSIDNEVWLNPDKSQVDATDKPQENVS